MDGSDSTMKVRPWTVYALTALGGAGVIWSVIADNQRNFWDIPMYAFGLWIAYSLWTGKRWAFSLSFMLTTLCAGLIVLITLVEVSLLDRGARAGLVWGLMVSAVWIALLLHPATKRYAGIEEMTHPKSSTI